MKVLINAALSAAVTALAVLFSGATARAEGDGLASNTELSLLGGIQALNRNDTALPDHFLSVPAVATLSYRVAPNFAVEGEFTWLIPVQQDATVGSALAHNVKTPDILAYQANLRASLPIAETPLAPYLAAGAGAMTFLSSTEADRVPQLEKSQTMFAVNFGAGVQYELSSHVALRGDFREFVAFPASDTPVFSSNGNADQIWTERGTVGLTYRF